MYTQNCYFLFKFVKLIKIVCIMPSHRLWNNYMVITCTWKKNPKTSQSLYHVCLLSCLLRCSLKRYIDAYKSLVIHCLLHLRYSMWMWQLNDYYLSLFLSLYIPPSLSKLSPSILDLSSLIFGCITFHHLFQKCMSGHFTCVSSIQALSLSLKLLCYLSS